MYLPASRPMPHRLSSLATTFLLLAVLGPAPLHGQQTRSLQWTESTRLEVPGALGAFLEAIPGVMETRISEYGIHVQGDRLRRDEGTTSTIIDLEEARWTLLDHEARAYTTMTLEEMGEAAAETAEVLDEALEGAREGMEESLEEVRAQSAEARGELRRSMAEAREHMEVRIDARATGDRQTIEGFSADRHLITAEIDLGGEAVAGVESEGQGTIVFLVELWKTDDFPDADALEEAWTERAAEDPAFQEVMQEMAASFEPLADALDFSSLAAWDPRVAVGLDALAGTFEALQGRTLKQVVNVAVVPEGAEFREEALLAWEPESMGDVLQAEAGEAAREAGREAAKKAMGRLGGMFGGGDEGEEEEPPVVRPLLRIVTETVNVRDAAPEAGLYEPPAVYTERELSAPGLQPDTLERGGSR